MPAAFAALLIVCAGCAKHQSDQGVKDLLAIATPGLVASSTGRVGYVDLDRVIAAHPLRGQLDALQNQITTLNAEAVTGPKTVNADQRAAQAALQRDLQNAEQAFSDELAAKRGYYEQEEAKAIAAMQSAALGFSTPGPAGAMSGMQQQYGAQIKQIQAQGRQTLDQYRSDLFKQDTAHLKQLQQAIAAGVAAKVRAKEAALSADETAYQISLARNDQDQRLNLKTKLENLGLTPQERSQYSAQLQDIDTREQFLINGLKARDSAQLKAYQKQLNADASSRFNAERLATEKETNQKLAARQKDVETQLGSQVTSIGGKFQQQLSEANKTLTTDPRVRNQVQGIHSQMQSKYVAEADRALAAYRQTRQDLVAKYSAVAHMQFQDNQALGAQIDRLSAQRRDLYGKIVRQADVQIQAVARQDGVSVVFASIAGAGSAVDLTAQVVKRMSTLANAPSPAPSGG
ncbi:MAG: hypothetical protein GIW99_11335 [Candidatus Eremiobacteraeota bacterium]|nr:hypothetical protein [Candidatus Eremiobacteraeota bacterium]